MDVDSDSTMLDSLTVTIALDSNDEKLYAHDPHVSSDIDYEEPPHPETFWPKLDNKIRISDLRPNIFELLSMFLNADAIGTLKNWEHVASQFGLSMNEIRNYRRLADPTEEVLTKFKNLPVNRLLESLCAMERLDLLISLQPYLSGLTASFNALKESPGVFSEPGPSAIRNAPLRPMGDSGMFQEYDSSTPQQSIKSLPTTDFIIVTHYETNRNLKKLFKFFIKNLRNHEPPTLKVLDINDCIDESNIRRVEEFFTRAKQIVLFTTKDYIERIANSNVETTADAAFLAAKHFHSLMSNEYFQGGYTNRRFRVVLSNDEPTTSVPLGWATNTLVYRFPENFSLLCTKLFDTENNKETVSLGSS